jgi:hypothetical protein
MIAEALQQSGLTVFFDQDIPVGRSWQDVIESTIRNAGVVLALFSKESLQSAWMMDEAAIARDMYKLIPIRLESVDLPLGFRQIQAVDLTEWNGDPLDPIFVSLTKAVQRVTRKPVPTPKSIPGTPLPPPPRVSRRAPKRSPDAIAEAELAGTVIPTSPDRPYAKPMMAPFGSIFVAHAGSDKPRIKPIIEVLIKSGYIIWIDRPGELGLPSALTRKMRGIPLGFDWQRGISQGVKNAKVVLAFWSHDAVDARREKFY